MLRRTPPLSVCLPAFGLLFTLLLLPGVARHALGQAPEDNPQTQRPEHPARPDRPQLRNDQRAQAPRGEGSIRDRLQQRRERFAEGRSQNRELNDEQLAEQHAEVLEVLEDIDPSIAERFRSAENPRPGLQLAMLERRFPEVLRLARLRQHDEDMYQLRVRQLVLYQQMRGLARQIRVAQRQDEQGQAAALDVDELRDDLEDVAEEHFQAEQAAEELEIERREQKLEELREHLKQRDRNERQIIERTIEELLSGETRGPQSRGPGMDRPDRPGGPRDNRPDRLRNEPPPNDQLDL
ncbi:MAG: hypothetical protein AAF328_09000 [Planctomycetota bacterium]